MMRSRLASVISMTLLVLFGCDAKKDKNQENIVQDQVAQSFVISEKSIWKSDSFAKNCFSSGDHESNCLINEIKKTGTADALRAAEYLSARGELGYVESYEKEGSVGIAGIVYPYRANTNQVTLLIPSVGYPVIDVYDISDDVNFDPIWLSFAKENPDVSPQPRPILSERKNTDDGVELIFSYPISNCRACSAIAFLHISYRFSANGKFLDSRVVKCL
ncbi:hypothetical protein [Candidatus Liberibacter sp.]|uniref:hypothetical protein n=1 Tax=Candidatus Liberibacter sp. TaxID=34022 RepID=UPI0015F5E638|nr:hypothetical protein [Candidatus Liberibacter sp.]MBA5724231.1 hypothetical protein [Candidatus Liberibacter sp.]